MINDLKKLNECMSNTRFFGVYIDEYLTSTNHIEVRNCQ